MRSVQWRADRARPGLGFWRVVVGLGPAFWRDGRARKLAGSVAGEAAGAVKYAASFLAGYSPFVIVVPPVRARRLLFLWAGGRPD